MDGLNPAMVETLAFVVLLRRNPMGLQIPVLIKPSIQRYAWGDPSCLPRLFGAPEDGSPWAEAWYGAHPASPAHATLETWDGPLDRLLEERRADILGESLARRYGGLPYLLKILACAKPLSIQVHPNRVQAAEGYAREEAAGMARSAPERSYRDPNHKPEILVAWTEFRALAGFLHGDDLAEALRQVPEVVEILPEVRPDAAGLRTLLEAYFALPDDTIEARLGALLRRLEAEDARRPFAPIQPAHWALRAHRELSVGGAVDRGLLLVFLLELVTLRPGEAIFVPPGVPHAYLEGVGLELMASSDNVLRAGLTPKHVDVEELLRVVRFDAAAPPRLLPAKDSTGLEASYPLPTEELDLRRITVLPSRPVERRANGPETVIAEPNQTVTVTCGRFRVPVERGEACLIPAGATYILESSEGARVFVAATPQESPRTSGFRGRSPTALAFGTSGLRGRVDDITDLEAYINTRGFVEYLISSGEAVFGTPVAIAGDLRPSTDRISRAVAKAITDSGLSVVPCGQLPTPALAYFAFQNGWPSIMVTGSHIPFDRNGIKFNKPAGEVLKNDEAPILAAVARVRAREYGREKGSSLFDDQGAFVSPPAPLPPPSEEAARLYRQRYIEAFPVGALKGMRLALYEHSAVGRELLADVLRGLGAEVHAVGRSEEFVAIDTEAIAEERLRALQSLADALVGEVGPLDALVSTDGDSDRPMLLGVDDGGRVRFFGGDILGAVVADYLGADCVVVPVSSSDAIDRHFEARGVSVTRTRIGSPWVIAEMATLPGTRRVGWEANGGFLLGTEIETEAGRLRPLPTRDATLPIVAALRAARREGQGLVELFSRLPTRHSRAGLLDAVDPAASRAMIERLSLGDATLRAARFDGEEVTVLTRDGRARPADPESSSRLRTLQGVLQRHFSPARGFGRLERIDVLDGLRMHFAGGDIAHVRPSGNAPQLRIYSVADTADRAEAIVADALAEPDGILRELLAGAPSDEYVAAIQRNIATARSLFVDGEPPQIVGTVCGSAGAQAFWQAQLDTARAGLGARKVISFHEDLPVNQAFGLLLLWQRLRPILRPREGALIAFVFGEGTRATPLTEAECGQKPALASFVLERGAASRPLSIVELALRTFAPVEAYLRRSGFSGVVVKWGDEVQIPTLDLSGEDRRFADADVVRFVSMRTMTGDDARNKDWVGVDSSGHVTAFIPRRPLAQMERLADRGLLQRREGRLYGGINLGSIALSRGLLDALLEEFAEEVNDPTADRSRRPDLDPQLFTAVTIAALDEPDARERAWQSARAESPAMERLAANMPGVVDRLRAALERFRERHGRSVRMVALDFGDQYWGDIGQHRQMYDLYMALSEHGVQGQIARALAGVEEALDASGNLIAGTTRLGPGVQARNSVLIDAQVGEGRIESSVLIGTRAGALDADRAFDILSTVTSLRLEPRSGSYKVVSALPVSAKRGERLTTVFLPDGDCLLRVHEDTDLRNRKGSYDVPILDNPMSFREAHERVTRADPARIEARRAAKRREVEASLDAGATR